MRTDIENWSIGESASLKEAMGAIDRSALGIVLVLDQDSKLLGTVTDGDVRRAILGGRSFEAVCADFMNREPITLSSNTSDMSVLSIMRERKLRHVPVVDGDRVIGLHLLSDLADDFEAPLPAVVMAGGLGSRLGDLTKNTPKPLLEVGGKPILEHIIEHLQTSGVRDVFISTRYLAEQIETHFGGGEDWGVTINYLREKERLGTAGALKRLDGEIQGPFLVMNGDLLTDFRVSDMTAFHKEQGADMTVAVRHYTMGVPFGVVEVEGVEIRGITEKPNFEFFVNAGIYIVEPRILHHIEGDRLFDITELMERTLVAGGRIVSFPIFEDWMDIGRPEDLDEAR